MGRVQDLRDNVRDYKTYLYFKRGWEKLFRWEIAIRRNPFSLYGLLKFKMSFDRFKLQQISLGLFGCSLYLTFSSEEEGDAR